MTKKKKQPASIFHYSKTLLAVAATLVTSAAAAMTGDSIITNVEWINIAIAGTSACVVFTAPNVPGAMYTKTIVAALMAALTAVASFITDGISASEWLQIAIAVFGALGVYAIPNSTKEARSPIK